MTGAKLRKLELHWHEPNIWVAQWIVGAFKTFGMGATPTEAHDTGLKRARNIIRRIERGDSPWVPHS